MMDSQEIYRMPLLSCNGVVKGGQFYECPTPHGVVGFFIRQQIAGQEIHDEWEYQGTFPDDTEVICLKETTQGQHFYFRRKTSK